MSDVALDARELEEAPPLPPLTLVVAIVAGVFGVLGLGVGLFQLVTSLAGGAFMVGSSGLPGMMGTWAIVAMGVGVLIILGGLLLSLLAAISGFMAAFARRVSALKWVAAALVVFDILAHLLWPVISQVVSMVLMFQELGSDAMMFALAGLVVPALMLVWSFLLVVFWAAVFFVMSRHGKAAVADAD